MAEADDGARIAAFIGAIDWLADVSAGDTYEGFSAILADLRTVFEQALKRQAHEQVVWLAGRTARNLAKPYTYRPDCPEEFR